MRLYKERAIHNDDPNNLNMRLVRYLVAIMNEYSLSLHKVNSSQWDIIMLKDEKCNVALNES
jgi:hypothetical protein